MANKLSLDILSLSGQDITVTGSSLYVAGVNAIAGISGAAPSVTSLTIPISIDTFGGTNNMMGRPAGWLFVPISGINYRIPFYN